MRRFFVHVSNVCVLAVILIGLPAVTGRTFIGLRVSDAALSQRLRLWGLGLATVANAAAALALFRTGKEQKACRVWALLFGALLGVASLHAAGLVSFHWLKVLLLWLKDLTGGGPP
jgi:hypothetical protein